jgi:hypothetical protein
MIEKRGLDEVISSEKEREVKEEKKYRGRYQVLLP